MSHQIAYTAPNFNPNSSDALLRTFGAWLNTQLAAAGWVQTADTGQANWTTIVRAVSGAVHGYEIWRMNDALQATMPVYMRVEHVQNSYCAFRLIFSLGTSAGTDGAGNLTGLLHYVPSPTAVFANSATSATGINWFACGDTGRFWVLFGLSGAGYSQYTPLGFFIERTKDAAGADTADGIVVTTVGLATNWTSYVLSRTSRFSHDKVHALIPTVGAGVAGPDTLVYPVFPVLNGIFNWPLRGFLITFDTLVSEGVQYTFSYYGASRTYIATVNIHTATPAGTIAQAVLLQWE